MTKHRFVLYLGMFALQMIASGCGEQQYFSELPATAGPASARSSALTQGTATGNDGLPIGTATPVAIGTAIPATPDDADGVVVAYGCTTAENCGCGGKKILICHIPEGNPLALHTLCIAVPGAVNGHGITFDGKPGGHGGDYPGVCKAAPAK